METMILDFAKQLYSFMSLKYEMALLKDAAEGGPPNEEYDCNSDEFTVDIARAVITVSHIYRSKYRRYFRSVATLLCTSSGHPMLYAYFFAKVTYRFYSPLKILVVCSFISEMYMFILNHKRAKDGRRLYISNAVECFCAVYRDALRKIADPFAKWDGVKQLAVLLTRRYEFIEHILENPLMEHPSLESNNVTDEYDELQGWCLKGYASPTASEIPGFKQYLEARLKVLYTGLFEDHFEYALVKFLLVINHGRFKQIASKRRLFQVRDNEATEPANNSDNTMAVETPPADSSSVAKKKSKKNKEKGEEMNFANEQMQT